MTVPLKEQIGVELDLLPEDRLEQLLQSLRRMRGERQRGLTVRELVERFGGSIPADELDRMDRAVEEAFEAVEPDA